MDYKDLKEKFEKKLHKLNSMIEDFKNSRNIEQLMAIETLDKEREETELLLKIIRNSNDCKYNIGQKFLCNGNEFTYDEEVEIIQILPPVGSNKQEYLCIVTRKSNCVAVFNDKSYEVYSKSVLDDFKIIN